MAKKRRLYSAEYKAQLVLELLTGKRSGAEIARTEKVKDSLLYQWRADVVEKLPQLFQTHDAQASQSERERELEQLIGQLTIENQALKKTSRWLDGLSRKGERR